MLNPGKQYKPIPNMKKFIIAIMAITGLTTLANAQIVKTSKGQVDFYSSTPVEDIDAHSGSTVILLNTTTRQVVVKVQNTSFNFKNKLMQEHFNEKYMESEKYPNSTFNGKINEAIDFSKDGSYDVTVTGDLNIHGVSQNRTINGKLTIKNGAVQFTSDFTVKVADHKIEIPQLVVTKVAEEIKVHVDATLTKDGK